MPAFLARRWLIGGLYALAALLLSWLLLWALVPGLAKNQLQARLSEKLGREVSVGKIEFLPWSLELTLSDLVVARETGTQESGLPQEMLAKESKTESRSAGPQFEVARIYVNASMQSLFRLAPVLDALEVDAPVLRVTQKALGKFDVDDVLAKLMEPRPDEESSKPVLFALYNIALRNGRIELQDDTQHRRHELSQLQLGLPFVSNLASKREVKVKPYLGFDLNGSHFESSAESTPFLDSRQTAVQLRWKGMDLKPYQGYLPASLPVRLSSGVLDTSLQIAFEQADRAVVSIRGQLGLSDVALQDSQDRPLLKFERLDLDVANLQPLQSRLELASLRLQGPQLFAWRDAKDQINWLALQTGETQQQTRPMEMDSAQKPGQAWVFGLQALTLEDAYLHWRDASAQAGKGGAQLQAKNLSLKARDIHWPMHQPLEFELETRLQAGTPMTIATAQKKGEGQNQGETGQESNLRASGRLELDQGELDLALEKLPLELAGAYLSSYIEPAVSGQLSSQARLSWESGQARLDVAELVLDKLRLNDKRAPLDIARLQVDKLLVDLKEQNASLERMALTKPSLVLERDARGRWMYERWSKSHAQLRTRPTRNPGSRAWALKLGGVSIDEGRLRLRDALPATQAVSVDVSALSLRLGVLEPLAAKASPTPVQLSARLGTGHRAAAGALSFKGGLGLAPVQAQGKLLAKNLPLQALEPYFADHLNAELVRADAGFSGLLRYASQPQGMHLAVQGDVELNDLRIRSALAAPIKVSEPGSRNAEADTATPMGALAAVVTAAAADRVRDGKRTRGVGRQDDLLAWKALALRGLDLRLEPAKPLQLSVRETALSDFFARVIVQPNGRLNLQDIMKTARADTSVQQNAESPSPESQIEGLAGEKFGEHAPIIKVGPVAISGGRVQFSDYFIRPNYSADLSELVGRLSAFSSEALADGQPQMADLELKGRAQGTAFLDITGQVNPLAKPLALDVRARARDLELPPLSPYSIKYAGHGIERGKLSMDVRYKIQPDGQLTASNKLVLNQLTFGEPVQGAPASLPVRLAVALLADRNGIIDLDLPVSGSLNDPQFRLAPVIFKILGNLIMKAVTAPFALLSGAFGGGEESGALGFEPGLSTLDVKAKESLDKVAKSLADKPALKLTVIGEASESIDLQGWKKAQLDRLLLGEKRRQALRQGQPAELVKQITEVRAPELQALTKALYSRADFSKPRNALGLVKDLPLAQMQALLLQHVDVPDDAMRELALARSVVVRDYLAEQKLPLERLFLGSPKTSAQDEGWSPRAQLSLSTQ
ncbi:DUF748 domain-containing protein [Comamonas composti]|uniref:DUF748 domain-containing protein n=1 Tax=Comamonas composti TaxID=408558 RepID=UPI0004193836|nr:DUF748 domain-containing protein [Comamonas composti]